jgi:hypothetical protein
VSPFSAFDRLPPNRPPVIGGHAEEVPARRRHEQEIEQDF